MSELQIAPIKNFVLGIYDGPHATPKEVDEGPVFLGIKNVSPEGRLDLSEIRHVSEQEYLKWTKRVTPQKNDVVFSYEATLHRYALIPEGFHGCLGRRMALVRPDQNKIVPRFLHYYFMSPAWRAVVEANVINGVTVDRIPIKKFPDFEVSIPPISKQRSISDILSAYDDLIENNRRRIQLLEQSARILYKEWFVHLRFPGHEHTKIIDGVPEDWERKYIPEVIDINPREKVKKGTIIRYVPMAGLSTTGMTVDLSESEMRTISTSIRYKNNDVLLARITPCLENGKTGFVNFLGADEIACGSTEFIVLRGRLVSPFFTYCLARTHTFRETAIKSMIGSSGRQRVQPACFDEFVIDLPRKVIRERFDDVVSPLFQQIATLVRQIGQLAKGRNLLLPKLMSGEIAV